MSALTAIQAREAISSGNLDRLCQLFDAEPELAHMPIANGRTWLHWASENGQAEIAQLLIDRGLDPNAGDEKGFCPLWFALNTSESPTTAKVLLKAGANPDFAREAQSLLHLAVRLRKPAPFIEVLFQHGAKPDRQNAFGLTPLCMAARLDLREAAMALLTHGKDLHSQDCLGALAEASFHGHHELRKEMEAFTQAREAHRVIEKTCGAGEAVALGRQLTPLA